MLEDFTINPKNFKLLVRKLKLISGDSSFTARHPLLTRASLAFETFGKPDPVLEVPVVKSLIAAARSVSHAMQVLR